MYILTCVYRSLIWGKFDPKNEPRLRRSILVISDEGSTQCDQPLANNQTDKTHGSSMPVANDDIDINEIEVVVNVGFTDDDIV